MVMVVQPLFAAEAKYPRNQVYSRFPFLPQHNLAVLRRKYCLALLTTIGSKVPGKGLRHSKVWYRITRLADTA